MNKFTSGSNLTGHPLIIFSNIMYLHSHPELSIQERKATLFDIFSELHGHYGDGTHKEDIESLRSKFSEFQEDCVSNIDAEDFANPIINHQRNCLDDIQLDLKKIISDLKILNEAKMGIVTEPTW